MDKIETAFLETRELQPFGWFKYIDNILFIWTHGKQERQTFLRSLNEFHTDIKLHMSQAKKALHFLTLKLVLY